MKKKMLSTFHLDKCANFKWKSAQTFSDFFRENMLNIKCTANQKEKIGSKGRENEEFKGKGEEGEDLKCDVLFSAHILDFSQLPKNTSQNKGCGFGTWSSFGFGFCEKSSEIQFSFLSDDSFPFRLLFWVGHQCLPILQRPFFTCLLSEALYLKLMLQNWHLWGFPANLNHMHMLI